MATNSISRIIERGSNTNGQYVRFEDGTLLQYGIKEVTSGTNSQIASSGVYSYNANVSFPVDFYDTSYKVVGMSRCGTGYSVPFGALPSTKSEVIVTNYDYYLRIYNSNDQILKIHWTAVGTWK